MTAISYVTGDATQPRGSGPRIIAHVCNDQGSWGKGFVVALSKRWPEPERDFRDWHEHRSTNDFALGAVRLVEVEPRLWVANMIGQHGIRPSGGVPPIRYDALATCLTALAGHAVELNADVHMPRIGAGLAGGDWSRIEPLIDQALGDRDVPVTVYDLP